MEVQLSKRFLFPEFAMNFSDKLKKKKKKEETSLGLHFLLLHTQKISKMRSRNAWKKDLAPLC